MEFVVALLIVGLPVIGFVAGWWGRGKRLVVRPSSPVALLSLTVDKDNRQITYEFEGVTSVSVVNPDEVWAIHNGNVTVAASRDIGNESPNDQR